MGTGEGCREVALPRKTFSRLGQIQPQQWYRCLFGTGMAPKRAGQRIAIPYPVWVRCGKRTQACRGPHGNTDPRTTRTAPLTLNPAATVASTICHCSKRTSRALGSLPRQLMGRDVPPHKDEERPCMLVRRCMHAPVPQGGGGGGAHRHQRVHGRFDEIPCG